MLIAHQYYFLLLWIYSTIRENIIGSSSCPHISQADWSQYSINYYHDQVLFSITVTAPLCIIISELSYFSEILKEILQELKHYLTTLKHWNSPQIHHYMTMFISFAWRTYEVSWPVYLFQMTIVWVTSLSQQQKQWQDPSHIFNWQHGKNLLYRTGHWIKTWRSNIPMKVDSLRLWSNALHGARDVCLSVCHKHKWGGGGGV